PDLLSGVALYAEPRLRQSGKDIRARGQSKPEALRGNAARMERGREDPQPSPILPRSSPTVWDRVGGQRTQRPRFRATGDLELLLQPSEPDAVHPHVVAMVARRYNRLVLEPQSRDPVGRRCPARAS